ncbi:hypothetical protein [Kitasatospora sp. NPDC004531]
MSTDPTPENDDAETEAVLSLQETSATADEAEVEAHGASLYSTWSITCVVKPPTPTAV